MTATSPLSRAAAIDLPDPAATCRLAALMGAHLLPGDVVLLEGGIGAGKTHLARCLIQSRLNDAEDVPSPTYTLVQSYDTDRGEIWHADLYRLSDADEIVELGLAAAFATAICLVEWPDRLGPHVPGDALRLRLDPGATSEARRLELIATGPRARRILADLTA